MNPLIYSTCVCVYIYIYLFILLFNMIFFFWENTKTITNFTIKYSQIDVTNEYNQRHFKKIINKYLNKLSILEIS